MKRLLLAACGLMLLPAIALADDDFFQKRNDAVRQAEAAQRGLPPEATWAQIQARNDGAAREREAGAQGLDGGASWDEIRKQKAEGARGRAAEEKGLPGDSPWDKITSTPDE